MTKRILIQKTRRIHRYLGLLLGMQFLMWTIGGLYFSWTNIDEIRGDTLKKSTPLLSSTAEYIAPSGFLTKKISASDSILSLELTHILKQPYYKVQYLSKGNKQVKLFHALTGEERKTITKKEAVQLARNKLIVSAEVTNIEYLVETGSHHEYRKRPLPAYAISFAKPANTTIYVSETHGNVQTFRDNKWRIFDFLWMLHTMDYQERDNFNNLLLRAFSLFGIFTIISGFSLYILTSKTFSKKKKTS